MGFIIEFINPYATTRHSAHAVIDSGTDSTPAIGPQTIYMLPQSLFFYIYILYRTTPPFLVSLPSAIVNS